LHHDLQHLLSVADRKFLKSIFAVKQVDDEEAVIVDANRRFKSVSGRFQKQLASLMDELNVTISHFIRCIKPNELQKPAIFNDASVMQQLRYNGMCTALELMQIGFPTRIAFDELYVRYAPYMPLIIANLKPITFCEALLVALDLDGGKDFQMGLTKVFFRAGKLQFLDELTSNSKDTINNIVEKVRKWLAHKRWKQAIAAVHSLNRFGKIIVAIRSVRRFRRAARFMVRMVRIWIPLVDKVRKKILTSGEYKRKREDEDRRKEEDRQAEIRRRDEEERKKKRKEGSKS